MQNLWISVTGRSLYEYQTLCLPLTALSVLCKLNAYKSYKQSEHTKTSRILYYIGACFVFNFKYGYILRNFPTVIIVLTIYWLFFCYMNYNHATGLMSHSVSYLCPSTFRSFTRDRILWIRMMLSIVTNSSQIKETCLSVYMHFICYASFTGSS